MDTVKLRLRDPFVADRILTHIKRSGLTIDARNEMGQVNRRALGYNDQFHGYVEGHSLYMAYNPRGPHVPEAEIAFHCSSFDSYTTLKAWCHKVFAQDLKAIMAARLSRLDLCINLGIPFETIQACLFQAQAKKIERWTSMDGRTLYLGNHPRRTRAYEKTVLRSTLDYEAGPIKTNEYGQTVCTRVEVQLSREKIQVATLGDLEKLIDLNPFDHLALVDIDYRLLAKPDVRSCHILNAYRMRVHEVGAALARTEFNRSGNLGRTITPYVGTLDLDLGKAWQCRCRSFFGEVRS